MGMKTWCTALLVTLTVSLLAASAPAHRSSGVLVARDQVAPRQVPPREIAPLLVAARSGGDRIGVAQSRTVAASAGAGAFDRALLDKYCVTCHNERRKASAA